MTTTTKICTRCKTDKPIEEYLKKSGRCRICRSEVAREYSKHDVHKTERDREIYHRNREQRRAQQAEYYQKNKEQIQAYRKAKREENKEEHYSKVRTYLASRPDMRIGHSLRNKLRRHLFTGKRTDELVGCSRKFIREWFEFNFELDSHLGMTMENYGTVWEIDHVKPCSKFDMDDEEQIKKCFHWTNTKPIPRRLNRTKSNKIYQYLILEQELRVKIFLASRS